jgi:putative hemolysin
MMYLELALVAVLIVVNGFLSMSELAIVSARRPRLQALAEQGSKGAARALELAADPGRFLSSVQIGITLLGILNGLISGATLGDRLGQWLIGRGLDPSIAPAVAGALVVSIVTYFSVVIGELIPKQLGLRRAEAMAVWVSGPMRLLSQVGAPLAVALDVSARFGLRLFGLSEVNDAKVTEEEVRTVVAEAASAGSVEPEESRMISSIMRLGDRPVRAVMTPRLQVDWVDVSQTAQAVRETVRRSPHSRLVAGEGSLDSFTGVILARDLLDEGAERKPPAALVREAPVVHDTMDALDAIGVIRKSAVHLALVTDEYGHFEGVVTASDILDAIVGGFGAEGVQAPNAVKRTDGSWLIEGMMPVEELADLVKITLPAERDYGTAAGFVLERMRRIPQAGEWFEDQGWRFEVVDMDGRRIDKLLVQRLPDPDEDG